MIVVVLDRVASLLYSRSDIRALSRCWLAKSVSTGILGRRTAPFPPFISPNREPHGFIQDSSTDCWLGRSPATIRALVQSTEERMARARAECELEAAARARPPRSCKRRAPAATVPRAARSKSGACILTAVRVRCAGDAAPQALATAARHAQRDCCFVTGGTPSAPRTWPLAQRSAMSAS